MSNSPVGADIMREEPTIVEAVSLAIEATLAEQSDAQAPQGGHIDALRRLAILIPILKAELERAATSCADSPVRALALAHLTEDIYRLSGLGQYRAAGVCAEAQAHTLAEKPLVELNNVLEHRTEFAVGTLKLPADITIPPGRKLLTRDTADLLKSRLKLTYFQANYRVASYQKLFAHRDAHGQEQAPNFPALSKIMQEGSADPKDIANSVAKLHAMSPTFEAQPDPVRAETELEDLVADALRQRNAQDVGKLIKSTENRLDAHALEREAAAIEYNKSLRFEGKRADGYHWELITDAEGHAKLMSIADDLSNPHTNSGKRPTSDAEPYAQPSASNETPDEQAPPIPEWASNPNTPVQDRPKAAFTDVGVPATGCTDGKSTGGPPEYFLLGEEPRPGETRAETNVRIRGRRLYQEVFDAIDYFVDPTASQDPQMPMKSRVDLLVTIDFEILRGALEGSGITGNGDLITAANARRLACTAGILPLILGGKGQPLDLGRKRRAFTQGQKRAIAARDRGCINPGCSMPAHRTEAHHVDPWSEGGQTRVSKGALLCVICHTAYHAGHFSIVFIDDIPFVVQAKSRDPMQRPTRNWVFHPEAQAA
ncbi:hypothetical protein CQ018_17850 [Arthrobacter sp. MYb227]|uniref:HNH endonuclease signature motif containing protein n=1 Tax=Arthrobacter sp. MYb227 TaxID=1848601 RepID=UPI000CFAF884|nr:HNH endonuclease signature motif containing protein [Arthrobacter sp. MYb227]PQZ87323.1 hypothetical protein CQ018_17850 [Arthrobacter sp. MYb227]